MLSKMKGLLAKPVLLIPVICLFTACRGAEPQKAQEPSLLLESQLQEAKHALSAKEEDNASLTRQLEAEQQARQREQEELKKQFDEARTLLEEKIATLSKQLSATKAPARREKDQLREMKATLADTEEERAAAVRELQDVKQLLADKEREAFDLTKQVEALKRVPPPKVPQITKTQEYTKPPEPPKTMSSRQPILDKLAGIPPWVWIASVILIVMLIYLFVRRSNARDRDER